MRSATTTLLAILIVCVSVPAIACIHAEEGYDGMIRSDAQEYAVFFNDGRQVLVIGSSLAAIGNAPESISLVTAVPTIPDGFDTAPVDLFTQLHAWHNPINRGEDGSNSLSDSDGPEPGGVEVLETVEAGPYEITPIQASGAEAVDALNAYLSEEGFRPLADELAAFYAEKGWTFLAVKVPSTSTGAGIENGALPPLQLSFETPNPVVPMKLEAGMGRFDARVYLFLDSGVKALELPSYVSAAFTDASVSPESLDGAPSSVTDFVEGLTAAGVVTAPGAGFGVTHLVSDAAFNTGPFSLLDWDGDFEVGFAQDLEDADPADTDGGSAAGDAIESSGCSVLAGQRPVSGLGLLLLAGLLFVRRRA